MKKILLIEDDEALCQTLTIALEEDGFSVVSTGDGRKGLPDRAPFKGIIVAASVPHLEKVFELAGQLSSISGRMVVPVGSRYEQSLHIVERNRDRIATHTLEGVTFNFLRLISNP